MRVKNIKIFCIYAFIILSRGAALSAAAEPRLLYEIRVPFEVGAEVASVLPDGRTFHLGRVVKLPEQTRWPSYTASAWGTPGSVTASAVNAVHILMGVEDDKGRTMSVIPQETIAPAAGAGAAIVLSSRAGTGFFGAWAPPVGTRITLLSQEPGDGDEPDLRPLESAKLPKAGDTLIFRVYEGDMPYMVDFENRPGGRVIAWYEAGPQVIARVIRPLGGTGRFEGTLFQDPGRIRANHSGVIDVSTSPHGEIGGFQIIPWDHALNSKEMQGAWSMTQWMIIAHPDGESMLGGTAPLFNGGLVPGTFEDEKLWDLWSTYGRKPLVLARLNGSEWGKLPVVSGRVDDGLKLVTHLRIYFPISKEPQADFAVHPTSRASASPAFEP
ncbi:MAG: hypothetical protein LBT31_09575 [Synergistaceae bacterium]|jgi:hypothetical protein|nr:hypothetical protein [Synergistaceae bacterium]